MTKDSVELTRVLGRYTIVPQWVKTHNKHMYRKGKEHLLGKDGHLSNIPKMAQWSQCGKKNRYRTEGEATEMMHRCEVHRPGQYRVYYCEICGGWHITSKADITKKCA